MEDQEVILNVESGRYLLTAGEAMRVAEILGSASTIGNEWRKGNSNFLVYKKPQAMSAAITPVPITLRMEIESNMREREGDNQ